MPKKLYTSPLFSGGLDDGGDHTEPYTNSQGIYTPDDPGVDTGIPQPVGLSAEQEALLYTLPLDEIRAVDTSGDGIISLEEFLAVFPTTSDSGE